MRDKRPLGRRRRRLYWTLTILVLAAVVGTAITVAIYKSNRSTEYRPGEQDDAITRRLELRLPEDAPTPNWVDATQTAGLAAFVSFKGERTSQLPEDMGSGLAWGDFDNDGDDDLFVVSSGGPLGASEQELARSRLYRNLADGTFEEVEQFPETRIHGMAAAWGDYDADGWLDLVLTGYDTIRLYHNQGGSLSRVDVIRSRPGFWSGVSWADYDNDSDLDLYVCGYVRYEVDHSVPIAMTQQYGSAVPYTLNPSSFKPDGNLLFRNDGGGTFVETAQELGVENLQGRSLGALWHDFDGNGWLDLYLANDISDNMLYLNHEGRFEDVSHAAWVADYRGAMGLAVGDWNRDGDDDLFVTHWIAQENALYDSLLGDGRPSAESSVALRFMDVADQRGLGQIALQRIGWGVQFADFDGDGWQDIAVANGSTFETESSPRGLKPQPSFLFWNRQGTAFHDLAPLDTPLATPRVSRGLALADYDRDGDVDLAIVDLDGGVRLLRNEMQKGNWIEFRIDRSDTKAPGRPPFSDGVRLVARVGEALLQRAVSSVSYLSQSSRTIHFGLGEAQRVETLELHWPGGEVDIYRDLEANAIWQLEPGSTEAVRLISNATPISREELTRFWQTFRAGMNAVKIDRDFSGAIDLFREALRIDPSHGDSLYYLGNSLVETGNLDEALEQFEKLMRVDPMSHRAYKRWGTLRALTAESEEQLGAAEKALERALEINKEATGALLLLGEVALIRGDLATARRRLEWVCRTNPDSTEGLFLLAYLAWREGDATAAEELLQAARDSGGEEWKPEGAAAEGDTEQMMHQDTTLLQQFVEQWNGSADAETAFASLETRLGS